MKRKAKRKRNERLPTLSSRFCQLARPGGVNAAGQGLRIEPWHQNLRHRSSDLWLNVLLHQS